MDSEKTGILHYNNKPITYRIHRNKISLKGEDVAKILEFENPSSIGRLLDPEDGDMSQGSFYIYESGIYSLTAENKEKFGSFKRWAIKEIEKKKQEEIQEIKRHSLRLKNKAIESKKRSFDDVFYISSSDNYAKQNRFKIGGVGGQDRLASRLANYNSRSADGDEWGYCFKAEVANFKQVESRVWDHLSNFRDKPKKEMANMHFDDLKEVVELTVKNYNDEVEFINNRMGGYVENLNYNRTEPAPVTIETTRDVEKKKEKKSYVILPEYDQLKAEIKKYMNDKKSKSNTPSVVFLRDEILQHCTKKFKKFGKRDAWRIVKEISEEQKEFRLIYS